MNLSHNLLQSAEGVHDCFPSMGRTLKLLFSVVRLETCEYLFTLYYDSTAPFFKAGTLLICHLQ